MEQGSGDLIAHRYRLAEQLGRGGMGVVWRAHDETFDRDVAIKEVTLPSRLDPDERGRIVQSTLHEAQVAARLSHPNVVKIYDVVESDNRPWIVMELVRARSLTEIVADTGPLPPQRVASIGLQLLSALMAAHAAGITHRDVKPGNVLCAQGGRVVLTDFGIASLEGEKSVTGAGVLMGSPAYIAPERVRGGPARAASDIWSLAATLYTAVEGRPPYDRGNAVATVTAVVTEEPEPFRLAGPLAPVLQQIFVKDPDLRPGAAAVRRLLRDVATRTRGAPALTVGPVGRSGPVGRPGPAERPGPAKQPGPAERPGPAKHVPAARSPADPPLSPAVEPVGNAAPAARRSGLAAATSFGLAAMSGRRPADAKPASDAGLGQHATTAGGGRGLAALVGGGGAAGLHTVSTRPRNLTLILAALSVVVLLAGSAALKDMNRLKTGGQPAKPVEELVPVVPSESPESGPGDPPAVVPSQAAERSPFPVERGVRYPVRSQRTAVPTSPVPSSPRAVPSAPAKSPSTRPSPSPSPSASPTVSPEPTQTPPPTPTTSATPPPEDPLPPPPDPASRPI